MKFPNLTSGDLKRVWRIIVALVLCQLLGGVVGLAVAMHHYWFMNFWLGGAAGMLPGFVLGLVWQLRSCPLQRGWIGKACFLGVLAVGVTGMAFGVAFPRMRNEMRNLRQVAQMPAEALRQIDVFDKDGTKRVVSITDPEALTAFARAISDAAGHSPNHPVCGQSWYVVVSGTTRHEFKLHFNPKFPRGIIGYFVSKQGNRTSYHGAFESQALRPWIERHVMQGPADQEAQ